MPLNLRIGLAIANAIGALGGAAAAPPVAISYLGMGGNNPVFSVGTGQIGVSKVQGSLDGDLHVAIIMRSSAATNAPAAWTLITTTPMASGGTDQLWIDVYTSTTTSGSQVTFSQAVNGPMDGYIISFRGAGASLMAGNFATAALSNVNNALCDIPPVTAVGAGLAIAMAADNTSSVTKPTTGSVTSGWTLLAPNGGTGLRLFVAIKNVAAGETLSGQLGASVSTANTRGWALASLIVRPTS